jgi:hypothetical protein
MPKIDEIINFLTNDLNIKISNKKIDLINNKFYPDIKDKIYWSVDIEERRKSFFYEGIITKEEYDLIKTLPPDTNITFNSDYKDDDDDEGDISEIIFVDDINEIKDLYDTHLLASLHHNNKGRLTASELGATRPCMRAHAHFSRQT